jgi:hypothetical protein
MECLPVRFSIRRYSVSNVVQRCDFFNKCATRKVRVLTIRFILQLPLCYDFVHVVSDLFEKKHYLMLGCLAYRTSVIPKLNKYG